MTTISSLNIVVQQGNSAQEVQNTRHQATESNQMVASQNQAEKDVENRTTVLQSGESEKNRLNKDGYRNGRHQRRLNKISAIEG